MITSALVLSLLCFAQGIENLTNTVRRLEEERNFYYRTVRDLRGNNKFMAKLDKHYTNLCHPVNVVTTDTTGYFWWFLSVIRYIQPALLVCT